MGLLTYSTTVSVAKTVGEITEMLASHGARTILLEYDQGQAVVVTFLIATPHGDRDYRLPARMDGVWRVLVEQSRQGKVPKRFVTREQAARVGWRIVRAWLEAQLAIIESEMVSLPEIMLPFMTGENGRTVYEAMVERRLALAPPGETPGR